MRLTRKPILHLAHTLCCIVLVCIVLLPPNMAAQQNSPTSNQTALREELTRLGAAAVALSQSLPSFICEETAVSQAVRDHKVVRNVPISGLLRVIRKPNGTLTETYDFKRRHILFFIPSFIPVYVSGGFDSALNYFLPGEQACYHYSLSPGRIDFEARNDFPSVCKEHGLKGFATLDAEGNVNHIERTIPPDVAKPLKLATFASIDLAPVELNGQIYQLSHHMVAEMPLRFGAAIGRFEANYTGCHLFTATVTLGPSSEVPSDDTSKPQ